MSEATEKCKRCNGCVERIMDTISGTSQGEWRPQWDALPTMTPNWLVARIDFPHTICPSWLFRGTDAERQARSLADFLNYWGAGDE